MAGVNYGWESDPMRKRREQELAMAQGQDQLPYMPTRREPAGTGMSWLDNPSRVRNLAGERDREAMFTAKYGMSPQDIMEAYRISKGVEGEVDPGGPVPPGYKFDAMGEPITSTQPVTTHFTPEQNRLKSMYQGMQERFAGPKNTETESQKKLRLSQSAWYDKRTAGGGGTDGKEADRLLTLRANLVEQSKTGGDVSAQLSEVDNKLRDLLQIPHAQPPAAQPEGPGWIERILYAIKPGTKEFRPTSTPPWTPEKPASSLPAAPGPSYNVGLAEKNAWRKKQGLPPLTQ